ncbi:hypothetical protein BAU01nite_20270 [Brevibacterium aurantiacum]|nr:hypothetical protein BAU01nite_20270 [Brevibacterium aurantiacum]
MLSRIKVDEGYGTYQLMRVLPRIERGTGVQRTNAEGVLIYDLDCVYLPPEGEGELDPLRVKFAGTEPNIPANSIVRLLGLEIRPWSMGDRSGLAASCDDVQVAKPVQSSQSAEPSKSRSES